MKIKTNVAALHQETDTDSFFAGALITAMHLGRIVEFRYDDKYRAVEIHAVGLSSKDGALIFRGYQVGGESSRGVPSWSLFRADNIEKGSFGVNPLIGYKTAREGYKMGDKQMPTILAEIDVS